MLPTQTGWDIGEVVDVVWHWQLVNIFFPCLPEALTQSFCIGLNFELVRMFFLWQIFLMVMACFEFYVLHTVSLLPCLLKDPA